MRARIAWRQVERWALILLCSLTLLAVLPYVGYRAWRLVDQPFPGVMIQPLVHISPYDHDAGSRWQHLIVSCNGRPVASPEAIMAMARAVGSGGTLHFGINDHGRLQTLTKQVRLFTWRDVAHGFVAPAVVGIAFLLTALFLLLQKPDDGPARCFAHACAQMGVFMALYFDFNLEQRLLWLSLPTYGACGLSFLAFATAFPRPIGRPRRLLGLGLAYGLALTGAWFLVPHDRPDSPGYHLLHGLLAGGTILMALGMLSIVVSAILRRRHARPGERQQLDVILLGTALTLAPFAIGWALPEALWQTHLLPLDLTVWFAGLLPLFIAYGISRHGLFDVGQLLRQSIAYSLLLAGLVLADYLLLWSLSYAFAEQNTLAVSALSSATIALLITPGRDALRRLVDRWFFREPYDLRKVATTSGRRLIREVRLDAIPATVTETLAETLHATTVAIYLQDQEDGRYHIVAGVPPLGLGLTLTGTSSLLGLLGPETRFTIQELPAGDGSTAAEPHLLVPLFWQDELSGFILLGEKASGKPLSPIDLDLLQIISAQAALAIINARSHQATCELNATLETRIAERTRALETAQAVLIHQEKLASIGMLSAGTPTRSRTRWWPSRASCRCSTA